MCQEGKESLYRIFRCTAPACRHEEGITGRGCEKGYGGKAYSEKEATNGGLGTIQVILSLFIILEL